MGLERTRRATHVEGGVESRPRCCHKRVGAVTLKPGEVRLKELKRSRHWSVRESRDGAGKQRQIGYRDAPVLDAAI